VILLASVTRQSLRAVHYVASEAEASRAANLAEPHTRPRGAMNAVM
jgi:hypothetical protein